MTMRRLYQHFPSRPMAESLVPLGHLEENDDGSVIVHLDAYPAQSPRDGNFRLLALPRPAFVPPGLRPPGPPRPTGIEAQLEQAPPGAAEAAKTVQSAVYPQPLNAAAILQMERDLEVARAAVAAGAAKPRS